MVETLAKASRLEAIPPSGTLKVGRVVRELLRQGRDVINLSGGVCDPAPDVLAVPASFPPDWNVLGNPAGQQELRTAIAAKQIRDCMGAYRAEDEIVVTVGAKEGLFAALMALIELGDEVLMLDPCWVTYAPSVLLAGGVPKLVRLRAPDFVLDAEAIAALVGPRTRLLILTTPHNPTGRVFTKAELTAVAEVVMARDLWVISDESFEKFVFDGHRHLSIATLPGMRERTVVLESFSKGYALAGTRVGFLSGPADVCSAVTRFNEQVITCASPLGQWLALQALSGDPDWTLRLQRRFEEKRKLALSILSDIPGVESSPSEGTFYLLPNIARTGMSSDEAAAWLLDQGVAITPGSAFGAGGEGFIRVNLVGTLDRIGEGLERMRAALRARGS